MQLAIITHSQTNYDKRGAIAEAIVNLSGLEQVVITSQPKFNKDKKTIYSADGHLEPREAESLISHHYSLVLLGGCLNDCHYRTYKSLVKAFKDSSRRELTIKLFLGGIFGDYFPSINVPFNLNEILDFNGVTNYEAREQAILSMFEKYTYHLESIGINYNFRYNGKLIYRNEQKSDKSVNIDVFDTVTK